MPCVKNIATRQIFKENIVGLEWIPSFGSFTMSRIVKFRHFNGRAFCPAGERNQAVSLFMIFISGKVADFSRRAFGPVGLSDSYCTKNL